MVVDVVSRQDGPWYYERATVGIHREEIAAAAVDEFGHQLAFSESRRRDAVAPSIIETWLEGATDRHQSPNSRPEDLRIRPNGPMSHSNYPDDPRCPACGEPIGATATYCMHCSTDLTELRDKADTDADGYWDSNRWGTVADVVDGFLPDQAGWFHPDGLIDNTLTVVVGAVGGLVVGVIGGSSSSS